jgi:hypothetical protein
VRVPVRIGYRGRGARRGRRRVFVHHRRYPRLCQHGSVRFRPRLRRGQPGGVRPDRPSVRQPGRGLPPRAGRRAQPGRHVRHRRATIPGSGRALGLDPTASPQFTNTPGQVAFTPDGGQLIVTTKANGNDIDTFGVRSDGRLSAAPVVNSEPGTVPFAISFDQFGHLVIAEAGTNALATFALSAGGTATLIDAVPTGASATCWVAPAGPYLSASNAGSASESGYTSSSAGQFLYIQTGGSGIVDEFAVQAGGTLTEIGAVTVPGATGGEGIVAF